MFQLTLFSVEEVKEFWSDGDALYPKMVTLLEVDLFRRPVLSGLILSIGSKNESTVCIMLRVPSTSITFSKSVGPPLRA